MLNFLLLNNPQTDLETRKQANTICSSRLETQAKTITKVKDEADSVANIAIITGADGHLGRSFCSLLPQKSKISTHYVLQGKQLLRSYANDKAWQCELADLLQKQPKIKAILLLDLDLANTNAYINLLNLITQEFGEHWQLNWLINNAGLGFKGPLSCQSAEATLTCLTVNNLFPTLLINSLLQAQRFSREQAYVINIASSSAFAPQANFAVYSASKSYLYSLSQALRAEWRAEGQRLHCTVACPGPMQSAFLQTANKFIQAKAKGEDNLVWYKKLALEEAKMVAEQAIKNCLANRAVSYSKPLTYLFRLFTKFLPTSWFAYFTSQN